MTNEDHGGDCCGRFHLYNFTRGPDATALAEFNRQIAPRGNMCCEVVLTDGQLLDYINHKVEDKAPYRTWGEALPALGFVQVARFCNPNTGRYCNVYLNQGTSSFIKRKRVKKEG